MSEKDDKPSFIYSFLGKLNILNVIALVLLVLAVINLFTS